jgi:hypothetical protein
MYIGHRGICRFYDSVFEVLDADMAPPKKVRKGVSSNSISID